MTTSNDLQGGRGDDRLEGGAGAGHLCVQLADDGTDTITDERRQHLLRSRGEQRLYAGATYAFSRCQRSDAARL